MNITHTPSKSALCKAVAALLPFIPNLTADALWEALQAASSPPLLTKAQVARQLNISLPTVKTHSSNLYIKLNVKRRTQAIHKAKHLKLIE